ncbi:hypothetical protein ACFX1T_013188 [Malus domestica]
MLSCSFRKKTPAMASIPFPLLLQSSGCAIRDSAFASTAALEASDIIGSWRDSRCIMPSSVSFSVTCQNGEWKIVQDALVHSFVWL